MADDLPIVPVVVDTLALALVATSDAPIVLLDGAFVVIAASTSFCRAFEIDPTTAEGQCLFDLGDGEWDVRQLRSLLRATLSGSADVEAYEMDLKRPKRTDRCLMIAAHRLHYSAAASDRLLLTVTDVTDARLANRLKDELIREKAVLFQELQHRVANSLQIIASVLMQTARKAPSSETKGYLHDAHSRVMSVAALQRQLALSSLGEVELKSYFTELCDSIAASMIQDHEALSLTVDSDTAVASADSSVSLGLIVTELVINALKHAFPDGRGGHIVVGYKVREHDWTLSVTDDGVGMPMGPIPAKAGLGSSIVQALAKQLHAVVRTTDAKPGTIISIEYKQVVARLIAPEPLQAV